MGRSLQSFIDLNIKRMLSLKTCLHTEHLKFLCAHGPLSVFTMLLQRQVTKAHREGSRANPCIQYPLFSNLA